MGWPERIDAGVVDQDIDAAVAKLDRFFRNLTGTRSIVKIGGDEVGLPARRSYLRDRLLAAFHISTYDQYVDAQLRQLVGGGPANSAGPACNQCGCRHLPNPFFPPNLHGTQTFKSRNRLARQQSVAWPLICRHPGN